MNPLKIFGILALTLPALPLQAQPVPEQLMVNISASGEVSGTEDIVQVACTIVSGPVPVAILAEARSAGTDVVLMIIDVTSGEPVVVDDNDDFGTRAPDDLDLVGRVLRLPAGSQDALAIGIAEDQAICAIAGEADGGAGTGVVNLQINDLSSIFNLYDSDADDGRDIGTMLSFLKTYTLEKHNQRSAAGLSLSDQQIGRLLSAAGAALPER